ncbi:unnamed protein product [Phytophthora fragariaefolia]|uniref:Unnamed protein product n=1 Tax=Phytophthora fragariaefolia TaxID=1490495 RepID=A0A9W6X721_9STRA|nr:unnamed protein product [Phytophthora fragariaefolia]
MVTLVLTQELVPLRDPKDGSSSNYGFWIRTSILVFVGIPTLVVQAAYFIDGVKIPVARLLLFSVFASVGVIASSVAICAHLIFPVPFFLLTMFPVLSVVLGISFRVIIGSRIIHEILAHRGQLARYLHFVNTKCLLIFVYPAYEALFRATRGTRYQLLVILLLHVMKLALKNIMRRRTSHIEDMTPEAVIFTVDLFNSTYMATCMQSASSLVTVTVISAIDLSLTIIMLHGLHRRTASTLARWRHVGSAHENHSLLTALALLCRIPDQFQKQDRTGIHVYSQLGYNLPVEVEQMMALLDIIPKEVLPKGGASCPQPMSSTSATKATVLSLGINRKSTVYPLSSSMASLKSSTSKEAIRSVESPVSEPSQRLLQESLETLFTIECLVVASYLEAVIPLFYTSYILMVVRLPSASYHTEMMGIAPQNAGVTVLPVFLFGCLQVLSLILLLMLIKRNCGMQVLYQLAFVMEIQMPAIQGKLMFWMLLTLCFRLVHFGTSGQNGALTLDVFVDHDIYMCRHRCRLHLPVYKILQR